MQKTHWQRDFTSMEISERETAMLAEVSMEVQACFADFTDLAHGWEHVYRVYHLAMRIAENEYSTWRVVKRRVAYGMGVAC
jgi:HD superfamily phosphodiesterase